MPVVRDDSLTLSYETSEGTLWQWSMSSGGSGSDCAIHARTLIGPQAIDGRSSFR